jgi:YYY domain-containing protein
MIYDIATTFYWWLAVFTIGIIFLPLTYNLTSKSIGLSFASSKFVGIICLSFTAFLFSFLRIIPFGKFLVYFTFFVFALINFLIFKKNKINFSKGLYKEGKLAFLIELIFIIGFFYWSSIRSFNPDIYGLEKFMDFGFINSILRSQYLPPTDMWYSGEAVNYYWFGHFITSYLTIFTSIKSSVSYNLMIALIFAQTLTSGFAIPFDVLRNKFKKINRKVLSFWALVSTLLLTIGGNLHTPIYLIKDGFKNYWYPNATRFIGYFPPTEDKTIHEFPSYSFVVSDLHAHLLNLPAVLIFITLLWVYINKSKNNDLKITTVSLGFLVGIFYMTNSWDSANYFLLYLIVSGLIILNNSNFGLGILLSKKLSPSANIYLKNQIRIMLLFAAGLIIPLFLFSGIFEPIAKGIRLTNTKTPLWQLGVLWGFPFALSAFHIFILGKNHVYNFINKCFRFFTRMPQSLFQSQLKVKKIDNSELFVVALATTSIGLIIIPEFFYIKDIYIQSHYRANTMFKLTYQSFVMFSLISGYQIFYIVHNARRFLSKIIIFILIIPLVLGILSYSYFATNSFYGNLREYKGLDGTLWLKSSHPETYRVYEWLNKNISGQPTILEAPGNSYSKYNVLSSYSGIPTVLGWFVHEWLWRGDVSYPQSRAGDIAIIYTSTDLTETKNLIDFYNIEYIIVGEFEKEKYPSLIEDKFSKLGSVIFKTDYSKVYKIAN